MGRLIYLAAGVSLRDLPEGRVDGVLLNFKDHALTPNLIENARRMLDRAQPSHTFFDSSGFSILQESLKRGGGGKLAEIITPRKVAEVNAWFNPTAMVALDFPVMKVKDRGKREEEFERKLQRNIKWTLETAEWRERLCPGVALFIPVQCYNLAHLSLFLDGIEGVPLHGFAMPTRNMGPGELALFLLAFHRMGVRSVHLLGLAAFERMAIVAFMAKHFFKWTSVDSTTWKESARHNAYLDPRNLAKLNCIERKNESVTCECPFCAEWPFTRLRDLPYAERMLLLRSHNYSVTKEAYEGLMDHAGSPLGIRNHLLGRVGNHKRVEEIYRTLCLVEALRDADLKILEHILVKSSRTIPMNKYSKTHRAKEDKNL